MTKYTPTWRISFPEGSQKVAVPADVEKTAQTTDAALTDAEADITESVMGQVDTQITAATKNVVYKQTPQAAWTRDEDDVAYTVAFEEGRRTWIESDTRGYPTVWSRNVLIDTLEPYWGGSGGGGGATVISGGKNGEIVNMRTPNPYPQGRDVLDEPFVLLSDYGGDSIGYPSLFFDVAGDLWACWSTDHAPNWSQSGIWAVKFRDGPLNGVDTSTLKKIFLSSTNTGAQCETPVITPHRYAVEGKYLMLFSKGSGRGKQSTYLASAPDPSGPWTDEGIVQQMESQLQPGNGHTGYLYPQRVGGRWQSTSRYGGTSLGRQGYWYGSEDWRTWRPDPRYQSDFIDVLETFDWFDPEAGGGGHRFTAAWPFRYNGSYWTFGAVSGTNYDDPDYGTAIVGRFVAPLADDMRRVKGLPIDLGLDSVDAGVSYIAWNDRAYGIARVGGPRSADTGLTIRELI